MGRRAYPGPVRWTLEGLCSSHAEGFTGGAIKDEIAVEALWLGLHSGYSELRCSSCIRFPVPLLPGARPSSRYHGTTTPHRVLMIIQPP